MGHIQKNKICLLFCLIIIFSGSLYAQQIKVGLFPDKDVKSLIFSVVEGNYDLYLNNNYIKQLMPGEIYLLSVTDNDFILSDGEKQYHRITNVELKGTSVSNVFQLKLTSPATYSSDFDDDLLIDKINNDLVIVNRVDLNKYIAGVIEAEGGGNAPFEYYKAQAILVRTYALRNTYRHASDGYNVCNNEHCQAYKGRSLLNKQIHGAVFETVNLVLTDTSGNLITAPFHSNCGGSTSTSEMVWQTHNSCLYSVKDPFCTGSKNATWTKQISLDNWMEYLRRNGFSRSDIKSEKLTFLHDQRVKNYVAGHSEIPFRKIREDLGLKSAFFNVEAKGKYVLLSGRGYGHGVGLCQEGAMEMARVGYCYTDILHFYFQNVKILLFSAGAKQ